jgi:hypothetical protein
VVAAVVVDSVTRSHVIRNNEEEGDEQQPIVCWAQIDVG